MPGMLDAAAANILSPMVLFFALGFVAALARSDLTVPEAIARGLSIYLMIAIGFKGGAELARFGIGPDILLALGAGLVLSFAIPIIAFSLMRAATRLSPTDAAAVSAHYGSVSVVTFVAGTTFLATIGIAYEGYMPAVLALMETPAIITGLWLARRYASAAPTTSAPKTSDELFREILLNGSIVLLIGSFLIGWATGPEGLESIAPFIVDPFKGVLCLFLLDMGLLAGQRFGSVRQLGPSLLTFGLVMPLIGGVFGLLMAWAIGLSAGGAMLLTLLSASASYIAVPAAMRLALPSANPSIYLTLSLAVTFPFNLTVGIPLYYTVSAWLIGGE